MEIHPAAQQELEEALDYYLGIDPELAFAFDEHYQAHYQRIADYPLLHDLHHEEVRRTNLTPRFSEYYIAYMVRGAKIVILAIGHARRRPHYWQSRTAPVAKES